MESERPKDGQPAMGNRGFELSLKLEGKLGNFIWRERTYAYLTFVVLRVPQYAAAVQSTLSGALHRLLWMKGSIEPGDVVARVNSIATVLTSGVCILTYMKLRDVNLLEVSQFDKFCRWPEVPRDLKVPSPFALAISQLGHVKVSSLPEAKIFTPTATEDDANKFLLPSGQTWDSAEYAQAMEYAESVGMQFFDVDLGVKLGSGWWLLRPNLEGRIYVLECTLPEDNYTDEATMLNTLFYQRGNNGAVIPIFNLSPVGTSTYGTMLRNLHADINLSTFFAIRSVPIGRQSK